MVGDPPFRMGWEYTNQAFSTAKGSAAGEEHQRPRLTGVARGLQVGSAETG